MAKQMVSEVDVLAQIPAARQRARRALHTRPHATQARYDRSHRRLHIVLTNGSALVIPVDLVPALREASDKDLAAVLVGAAGVGLRWERLDADLSVAALAKAALGAHELLRAAGSAGGASRTPAKARAARLNGRKGGRPSKSASKTAAFG